MSDDLAPTSPPDGTDTPKEAQPEETLDPRDWEGLRALGHRMVDDMFDHMQSVGSRPPWRHAPPEIREHFTGPLPPGPQPPEEIYREFTEKILAYPFGNDHPRFWGWVLGTGTPLGALADFLAAAMNTNTGGGDYHSANYVERQVVEWIKEMLGFPQGASGVLTSGGSASNLIGLAVARHAKAGLDVRRRGLQGVDAPLTLYASDEIHSSVQKNVELLGLGSENLRLVPTDDQYRIDVRALEAAVTRDRASGRRPFCIAGAAGTTNTGAVDDLNALADLAAREDLWLHVDGAFGAWAAATQRYRHVVAGLERADSLALDLHKWMYMPYAIGAVLVRDEGIHRSTFALTPAYLAHGEGGRGMAGGDLPWFSDYSFELSREFRALKAWMSLKEHGAETYGRLVQQNIEQAHYLARAVEAVPELELVAPVTLNVVCFRYTGSPPSARSAGRANHPSPDALASDRAAHDAALDELNKRIVQELQEAGVVLVSGSTIRGRYVIHVANTNHRSRRADFDVLVREVVRTGAELGRSQASS